MSRLNAKRVGAIIICQQIVLSLSGSAVAGFDAPSQNRFTADGVVFTDANVGGFTAADGAAAESSKAAEFVRGKHEELRGALKVSKDPKTDPKLLAIFEAMLDYDALTRDSLGSEWESLNPEQRVEFAAILKQLIQKSYRKNLSDTSGYEIQFIGVDQGPDAAVVKTLAQNKVNKREKPLGINYVVSTTPAGFKVRDVVTDEVSLVGNYRNQFKRIIKKKGFTGLVEQMRKQLDK